MTYMIERLDFEEAHRLFPLDLYLGNSLVKRTIDRDAAINAGWRVLMGAQPAIERTIVNEDAA